MSHIIMNSNNFVDHLVASVLAAELSNNACILSEEIPHSGCAKSEIVNHENEGASAVFDDSDAETLGPTPSDCCLESCRRCRSELDQFARLPDEIITCYILPLLDIVEICEMKSVSKRMLLLVREYFHRMRALDITGFEHMLTEEGLNYILKYASNLQELRLDHCWRAASEANLLTVSKKCPNLRVLSTNRNQSITYFNLLMLAEHCPLLQELDLSSCFHITDEGVCTIARSCRHLREIHLSSNYGISDISVKELALNCPDLEELDVSYCHKVSDVGLREFCNNTKSKLKLLRIKNCAGVSQEMVQMLFQKGVVVNNMF